MKLDEKRKIKDVYTGYSYFREGDIVIAKVTPCFENGNIAIAEGLQNGIGFGTTEIFTVRPTNIDTRFLFYRLQEQIFEKQGISSMYGVGGLKRVPADFIRNFKIAVPFLLEQEQIANFLDEKTTHIDSIVKSKEKIIVELEEYKRSFIYEYVTGKKEIK